jgi:hypothetical protein
MNKFDAFPKIFLFFIGSKLIEIVMIFGFRHARKKVHTLLLFFVKMIQEVSHFFLVKVSVRALLDKVAGNDLVLLAAKSIGHFFLFF